MYPKEEGDDLRDWMCHFDKRWDHVKRQQEKLCNTSSRRKWREFRKWVEKRFPSFVRQHQELEGNHIWFSVFDYNKQYAGTYSQEELTKYLKRRKAFMDSVKEICFAPKNEIIVLFDSKRCCAFLEKIGRKRFELDCHVPSSGDWFVLDKGIHVRKDKDDDDHETKIAEYYRCHMHQFVRNLFRFHDIPFEEKLSKDAIFFLSACL